MDIKTIPEEKRVSSRIISITQKTGEAAHVSKAVLECGHWFNFQPASYPSPPQRTLSVGDTHVCGECSDPEFYNKIRSKYQKGKE